MKKIFGNLKVKFASAAHKTQVVVASVKAEGYVDSGVKILIAIVIGALLLTLLYSLFNNTVMPNVTDRIVQLFTYNG